MGFFLRTFAPIGAIVTALVATSLPSSAAVHGANLLIRSQGAPAFCLDASLDRGKEGRSAYIYSCHGRYNQRWNLTHGDDKATAIVAFDSKCVDIRGRSVRDNTSIQLWSCHYGPNQQFAFASDGTIREVQSGKCLTIGRHPGSRHPVFIDDCDGNSMQRWSVTN